MNSVIGIRREDKNQWERRTPLTPEDVKTLIHDHGLKVLVQPSDIRAFTADEFRAAGAEIQEDLSPCSVVFAVKEIPLQYFHSSTTYVFFAHVIKGQLHNMPMLKKMMELKCQLIEYETITDSTGRRLIFFGRHAGLAGILDTMWAFGQRLAWEDTPTPFQDLKQAYNYESLDDAKRHFAEIGRRIKSEGLPAKLCPLIVGIAGYGNVSRGIQEIFDFLQVTSIEPEHIPRLLKNGTVDYHTVYKVVFKEEHLVKPVSPKHRFDLKDYYAHPEKYRSRFDEYLPYLTVLVNANYWDNRYPRLVTKSSLIELFSQLSKPRLRVIGDIGCDVEGSIECNTHITDPGDPVYVYNPFTGTSTQGVGGVGPVVLAVDNLPCEIPRVSSHDFSKALAPFVPAIAKADYSVPFDQCSLPQEIKNAMILYHGELTPGYKRLEKYL
jgi:alanine dehydrogenase